MLTYRNATTGFEAGVSPVERHVSFALFVEETDAICTGLALFKPEADSEIDIGGPCTNGSFADIETSCGQLSFFASPRECQLRLTLNVNIKVCSPQT